MSFFKQTSIRLKKKEHSQILEDVVLHKSDKPNFYIISEENYSNQEIDTLKRFISSINPSVSFTIINAIIKKKTNYNKKMTNVVKTYIKYKVDYSKYIPKGSNIIVIGRGLYSLIESDDLFPTDFVDYLTGKNSFYLPSLDSQVYPLSPMYLWLTKDSFQREFSKAQIEACIENPYRRKRIIKPKLYDVFGKQEVKEFFNKYKDKEFVAWDIESSSLDWRIAEIGYIQFAFNTKEAFILKWQDINKEDLINFLKDKKQILQNGKYDTKVLANNGIPLEALTIYCDTWNLQHIWKEDNKRKSLKTGAWRLTPYGGYDRELDNYVEKYGITNYLDIPYSIMREYAGMDAIVTFYIFEELNKIFKEFDEQYPLDNGWSLYRYTYEIVMPTVDEFKYCEYKGVRVNREECLLLSEQLLKEISILEKKIKKALHKDFKVSSPKQMGNVIKELDWKIDEWDKKGTYPLTGEFQLNKWLEQGHEEVKYILEYREKSTLLKNFIGEVQDNPNFCYDILTGEAVGEEEDSAALFEHMKKMSDNTYRIFPTFLPMLANSHRSKHRDPNLANIPSHGKKAHFVRRAFCPDNEDFVYLAVDQSGLQLRLGCVNSGDEVMRDIFINGDGDLHLRTAYDIFIRNKLYDMGDGNLKKINYDEAMILKKEGHEEIIDYRYKGKGCNFSLEFGSQPLSFAKESLEKNWTIEEAENYINENELDYQYYYTLASQSDFLNLHGIEALNFAKYWCVAVHIKKTFFETYFGLGQWIKDSHAFVEENGYIRSIYGAIRRLPELLYVGVDDNKTHIKNLYNISLNSPIQNEESVIMNRSMRKVGVWCRENKMKSYNFSATHDAVELLVHKDELKSVCLKIKEEFEKDYPEYNGVPFEVEGNIADYWGTFKAEGWEENNKLFEVWDIGKNWNKYIKGL